MSENMIAPFLISENPDKASMVARLIGEAPSDSFRLEQLGSFQEIQNRLGPADFDMMLLLVSPGDARGRVAFDEARRRFPATPLLVLFDEEDGQEALAFLESGAQDCLALKQLDAALLARSIRHGLARSRAACGRDNPIPGEPLEIEEQRSRMLEQQVKAQSALVRQLRELDRMKADFVETVSHELRTPMTPLRSAIELMLDGIAGEMTPKQTELLQMMERNILRLARFSTDVLSLSRLDAGHYPLTPRNIPLEPTLRSALKMFQSRAEDKGSGLSLELENGMTAFADPKALGEVMANLLDNAFTHTPAGSRIVVAAGLAGANRVEIRITDDGRGIPEEEQAKIFDRFYQARRKYGPGYQGAGIGLCVSESLVEKMGGEISVSSIPGEGTTFRIALPRDGATREVLFGKIALDKGYVTSRQLEDAVDSQQAPLQGVRKLGELMMEKGYLEATQRDEILEAQSRSLAEPHPRLRDCTVGDALFGHIARKSDFLTDEQLNLCLCEQERLRSAGLNVRLGEVCVHLGLLSEAQCIGLIEMQGMEIQLCPRCQCRYNAPLDREGLVISCPSCSEPMGR